MGNDDLLVKAARKANLKEGTAEQVLASNKWVEEASAQLKEHAKLGIRGVPSVWVKNTETNHLDAQLQGDSMTTPKQWKEILEHELSKRR